MSVDIEGVARRVVRRVIAERARALVSSGVLLEQDDELDATGQAADEPEADAAATSQTQQAPAGGELADVAAAAEDIVIDEPEPETPVGGKRIPKAAYRDQEPPKPDDLTLDMFVKKLNAIRMSPSLANDDVRSRFAEYLNGLSPAERVALYAFLEGLAESLVVGVDPHVARRPTDEDVGVEVAIVEGLRVRLPVRVVD